MFHKNYNRITVVCTIIVNRISHQYNGREGTETLYLEPIEESFGEKFFLLYSLSIAN